MKDSKYRCYLYRDDMRQRKTSRRWRQEYKGQREPGWGNSRESIWTEEKLDEKLKKKQMRNLNDHRTHWHPGCQKLGIKEGLIHWVRRATGLPTYPDNEVQALLKL